MFSSRFFVTQAVYAVLFIVGFHVLAFGTVYRVTADALSRDTIFPFLCVIGIGVYIVVLFTIWSAEEPVREAVAAYLRHPALGEAFGRSTATRFYGAISFAFLLTSIVMYLGMAGMPPPIPFSGYLAGVALVLVIMGGRLDWRIAKLKQQPAPPA
ncbi:MAG TPA: hypothetical protein VF439_00090 [Candidatus Paceibacterota bacterium]